MTEAELQSAILETAKLFGWLCYHTHDSRRSQPGFPDLCMVRGSRLVFAELKSATGRISSEQAVWIAALRETGVEAYFWRPEDLRSGEIDRVLKGRP